MKIMLNGKAAETGAATLAEALAELGYAEAQVATAVNEVFIPKSKRQAHRLSPGDRVEVVTPRQGG